MDELFRDYDPEEDYIPFLQCTRVKGYSKLMYLIIKKHDVDVIKNYLDKYPEEIHYTNSVDQDAFYIAFKMFIEEQINQDICDLLLTKGANINRKYNEENLLFECRLNKDKIKYLLDNGININEQNHKGNTIIMDLCKYYGCVETIKLMLEYGADINIKNYRNETAIDLFKERHFSNKLDILDTLLKMIEIKKQRPMIKSARKI